MKPVAKIRLIVAVAVAVPLILLLLFSGDCYYNSLRFQRLESLELEPNTLKFDGIIAERANRTYSLFSARKKKERLFAAHGNNGDTVECYEFGDEDVAQEFEYALANASFFDSGFQTQEQLCVPKQTLDEMRRSFYFGGMAFLGQILLSVFAPLLVALSFVLLRYAAHIFPESAGK